MGASESCKLRAGEKSLKLEPRKQYSVGRLGFDPFGVHLLEFQAIFGCTASIAITDGQTWPCMFSVSPDWTVTSSKRMWSFSKRTLWFFGAARTASMDS